MTGEVKLTRWAISAWRLWLGSGVYVLALIHGPTETWFVWGFGAFLAFAWVLEITLAINRLALESSQ